MYIYIYIEREREGEMFVQLVSCLFGYTSICTLCNIHTYYASVSVPASASASASMFIPYIRT